MLLFALRCLVQIPELLRLVRELIAEIGMSNADQAAATLRNVAVHQVHAAIFSHEILNIGTQRSDHTASHERRSDL